MEILGVAVTPEAALIAIGWVSALLFGVFVALYVTAPAAKRLVVREMLDETGPVQVQRRKEQTRYEEFVSAKVDALKSAVEAIKPPDLSRIDQAQAEASAQYARLRAELEPLLQRSPVLGEDGKPLRSADGEAVVANTLTQDLQALIGAANGLWEASLVEVQQEDGQVARVPIGPNIQRILRQALVEYAASEKGKEMAVLRMDAKDRVDAANLAKIQAAAEKLQEPGAIEQLQAGAQMAEEADFLKELITGKEGKGGIMTPAQFDRALSFAQRHGLGQEGVAKGRGGGGSVQGAQF